MCCQKFGIQNYIINSLSDRKCSKYHINHLLINMNYELLDYIKYIKLDIIVVQNELLLVIMKI